LKSYGETIKHIRKSKGIVLKALAGKDLSISLLSQFENNKTTISCERFHTLLRKLEVSYDEFVLLHTEEMPNAFSIEMMEYLELMRECSVSGDIDKLTRGLAALESELRNSYSLRLDHMIQLLKMDLALKEILFNREGDFLVELSNYRYLIEPAQAYLLNVDDWGIYELRLFSYMAVTLAPDLIWRFLQSAIKKSERFCDLPGNQNILYETLITVATAFCSWKEYAYAFRVITIMKEKIRTDENVEYTMLIPFVEGWVLYLSGEEEQGMSLMDSTITMFSTLKLEKKREELQFYQEAVKMKYPTIWIFV